MRCRRCEDELPREAFVENDKLEYGITPWCRECLEWLHELPNNPQVSESQARTARLQYKQAYQQAYHAAYRQRTGRSRLRARRGAKRFTRAIAEHILHQHISVLTLRRQDVQAEWLRLLPLLRQTPTWEQFEEEVVASSGADEDKEQNLVVIRVLGEELYPELALVFGNSVAVEPGDRGPYDIQLTSEAIKAGWERLVKCIEELYQ